MTTELLSMCSVDLQENFHSELSLEEFASKRAAEASEMLSLSVLDHFRCPKDFLDFGLSGELSFDEGFFRFGPDITCYGRSVGGNDERQGESSLHDTFKVAVLDDGKVSLPFDATEVINNLRVERYPISRAGSLERLLKRAYYLVRPFTNLSLRRQVQRFHARNWKKQLFPHWPVDTTVENLCETLLLLSLRAKNIDRIPFVWFWPRGARGCVMMTHDVETEAGRNFCADLMDLDDSFGIKASFQIVPESRYRVPAKLLEMMRSRGFEVGIQDLNHDGRLFDDREEFQRRAALINRYAAEYEAKGFRSAVLYRKPLWYDAFDFSFDMSMPNVAHVDPQHGGCCTVMPYFIDKILELPVTTTQDYMLFHILNQRSIDLWKNQVEIIMEKNSLVSFIVHPDYVREHESKSVYLDLLGYLRDLRSRTNVWAALPHEVDTWWRARSAMTVEPDGSTWRVVGEGSERAVLAYAKNVDGKLVYELSDTGAPH
jgi:hypothetical protein